MSNNRFLFDPELVLISERERQAVQVPDLVVLNHQLLEEISTVQMRMVEVIRENFKLKMEVEDLRRRVQFTTVRAEAAAAPRRLSPLRSTLEVKRQQRHLHLEPWELEDPMTNSILLKQEDIDSVDLRKLVADMSYTVGELADRTKHHETVVEVESHRSAVPIQSSYAKERTADVVAKQQTQSPGASRLMRSATAPAAGLPPLPNIAPAQTPPQNSPVPSATIAVNSGETINTARTVIPADTEVEMPSSTPVSQLVQGKRDSVLDQRGSFRLSQSISAIRASSSATSTHTTPQQTVITPGQLQTPQQDSALHSSRELSNPSSSSIDI